MASGKSDSMASDLADEAESELMCHGEAGLTVTGGVALVAMEACGFGFSGVADGGGERKAPAGSVVGAGVCVVEALL